MDRAKRKSRTKSSIEKDSENDGARSHVKKKSAVNRGRATRAKSTIEIESDSSE